MDETPKAPRGQLTLLEVVLVLAILGGVLAYALHATREATMRRNEEGAIASIRAIGEAEEHFADKFGESGMLAALAREGLIDPQLDGGRKGGYSFVLKLPHPHGGNLPNPFYLLTAAPLEPGKTGARYFYSVDRLHDFTIHAKLGAPASSADSPIY